MFNSSIDKLKCLILVLAAVLGYSSSIFANTWLGDESSASPEIQFDIIDHGQDRIIIEFNIDALKLTRIPWENGYEAEIPGEGHIPDSLAVGNGTLQTGQTFQMNWRYSAD